MPPFIQLRVLPFRLKLSQILPGNNIVVCLHRLLAVLVVINTLATVAFDNLSTEDFDRFICHLTFTSALVNRLQILDRVLRLTFLLTMEIMVG
jgi:hypothetical protein